jgi:hypothetical protein
MTTLACSGSPIRPPSPNTAEAPELAIDRFMVGRLKVINESRLHRSCSFIWLVCASLAPMRRLPISSRFMSSRRSELRVYVLVVQGSELVGSVLIGVADILTDGIAYSRLLNGDVKVPHKGYYVAYATILCFGVITIALAIVYRLRNARLMRAHMRELGNTDPAATVSAARRQAQQHEWELAQTHRTKAILSLGLLNVAAQGPLPLRVSCMYRPSSRGARVLWYFSAAAAAGLPMSILNICLIVVSGVQDKMVRRSRSARSQRFLGKLRESTLFRGQVLTSLLVSVLFVGIKVTGAKEIVQLVERRKELKANLVLLQVALEDESKKAWIGDVAHDSKQRMDMIAETESASGLSYSMIETGLLDKGAAMFAAFDSSPARVTELEHSATINRSETKLEVATGLLLGRAVAMIRASALEIATYMLDSDSRHMKLTADRAVFVRQETLERVNAHHTITFHRVKATGVSDRTFLNSTVAKRVANDPPTYMVVSLPIAQHDKITRNDEKGAVRAENCRAWTLTEVAVGITEMDYTCSLNLRGSVPQVITNKISVPGQMHGAPAPLRLPHRLPHAYTRHLLPRMTVRESYYCFDNLQCRL